MDQALLKNTNKCFQNSKTEIIKMTVTLLFVFVCLLSFKFTLFTSPQSTVKFQQSVHQQTHKNQFDSFIKRQ